MHIKRDNTRGSPSSCFHRSQAKLENFYKATRVVAEHTSHTREDGDRACYPACLGKGGVDQVVHAGEVMFKVERAIKMEDSLLYLRDDEELKEEVIDRNRTAGQITRTAKPRRMKTGAGLSGSRKLPSISVLL